jgi:three-Cys-motif partner protein
LLRRDAQINQVWQRRLDEIFGSKDWFDAFYRTERRVDLFGEQISTEKVGDFASISQYFVERLRTVFTGVADNPLPLYNSRGNPLYLLCFAAGNPKGAKPALRIAQDILKR